MCGVAAVVEQKVTASVQHAVSSFKMILLVGAAMTLFMFCVHHAPKALPEALPLAVMVAGKPARVARGYCTEPQIIFVFAYVTVVLGTKYESPKQGLTLAT